MKIKQEHYLILESAMQKVITKYPTAKHEYKKAGLSNMRFRWDMLHLANLHIAESHNCHGDSVKHVVIDGENQVIPLIDLPLYDYMNDTHIDTALKKITSTK